MVQSPGAYSSMASHVDLMRVVRQSSTQLRSLLSPSKLTLLIRPPSTSHSSSLKAMVEIRWSTERTQSRTWWTIASYDTTTPAYLRKQRAHSARVWGSNSPACAREVASMRRISRKERQPIRMDPARPALRKHPPLRQVAWWITSWRSESTSTKTMKHECRSWSATKEVRKQSTSSNLKSRHLIKSQLKVVAMTSMSCEGYVSLFNQLIYPSDKEDLPLIIN